MSTRRKILRTALWSLSITSALLVILVVHIAMVTKPSNDYHANWQLSRIDFDEPLHEKEAQKAMVAIKSVEGVKHAFINKEQGTLVYSYEVGALNADQVFEEFSSKIVLKAKPYKAPKMEDASGCPAIDKSSMTYRFTTFVQNALH